MRGFAPLSSPSLISISLRPHHHHLPAMTPSPSPASASTSALPPPSSDRKPKRKRVSRACDQCFLKKDRCDGLQPICTFCTTLSRTCTYDRPERKRGPTQGLRPRLEARIAALETVLGFVLERNEVDVGGLKGAGEGEREKWRKNWWKSTVREGLEREFGLREDLVSNTAAGLVGNEVKLDRIDKVDDESDQDSDVDLALPPTHQPPSSSSITATAISPPKTTTTTTTTSNPTNNDDEISDSDSESHFAIPLLSSGIGGSSLNRGLVPRGADPNAALGGFEIEFGGNQTDEDWVRSFVPPKHRGRHEQRGSR
ncbi:C6 transcription factor [Pseudozyma hubeiensis SY62]|uniref:C6 transcription factor n=1 Tax=Pseudozyma hubeiensis (strain SY62) TaxID=1305764 RepID=R9P3S3_PSEHS|nr:C6 transcription factor [Pseudozyma hubeiensis SY62]GAC96011.1 C6 transcription factor [Pseudozyma hubeiensis SY62]